MGGRGVGRSLSSPHAHTLAPSLKQSQTDWDSTDKTLLHSSSVGPQTFSHPRHSPCHSLAVPQRQLLPLGKAATGIQSQALTVPMRTGKHTVIGGAGPSQESRNPPGKKKKHQTPYRGVSCRLLPQSFFFFIFFGNFFQVNVPHAPLFRRLSREMSTAKVSEALSMVQIIACAVASSFFFSFPPRWLEHGGAPAQRSQDTPALLIPHYRSGQSIRIIPQSSGIRGHPRCASSCAAPGGQNGRNTCGERGDEVLHPGTQAPAGLTGIRVSPHSCWCVCFCCCRPETLSSHYDLVVFSATAGFLKVFLKFLGWSQWERHPTRVEPFDHETTELRNVKAGEAKGLQVWVKHANPKPCQQAPDPFLASCWLIYYYY